MAYGKVLLVGDAIDAGLRKIKVTTAPDNGTSIDLLSTDVTHSNQPEKCLRFLP